MFGSQPLTAIKVRLGEPPPPLSAGLRAEIDALWCQEQARRGSGLFDGQIFSVREMAPPELTGNFVPYRVWLAQRRRPDLFEALRLRPLAVSGLLCCADGIVFGRRGSLTTDHPAQWELVPSGGIEPGCVSGRRVEPLRQILSEAKEEIGLAEDEVATLGMFGLIEDLTSHVIDLGIALASPCSAAILCERHRTRGSDEYTALSVVAESDLAGYIASPGSSLIPVSAELLRLWREKTVQAEAPLD